MLHFALIAIVMSADTGLDVRAMPPEVVAEYSVLLDRRDVQAELQMTPEQIAATGMTERFHKLLLSLKERVLEQTNAANTALMQQVKAEKLTWIVETFSPQQTQRLREIHRQYQSLIKGPLAAMQQKIEFTEPQQKLLGEIQSNFEADIRQVLWDFQRQSQRELQQVMTPEQQELWQAKVGKSFEFQSTLYSSSLFGVLQ